MKAYLFSLAFLFLSLVQGLNTRGQGTTVKVFHVYSPQSPFRPSKPVSWEDSVLQMLAEDQARLQFLSSLVGRKSWVPIASGRQIVQSPTYIVKANVGTPAQTFLMALDTSNDAAWIPCNGCVGCSSTVFNSVTSTTFKTLGCDAPQCKQVPNPTCGGSTCTWNTTYGGSTILSNLTRDTIALSTDIVPGYTFGCIQKTTGSSVPPQGLLGLGRGPLSFLSQTQDLYKSTFSYCLPSFRTLNFSGTLRLGPAGQPLRIKTTPLLKNPRRSSLYYVNLIGIRVGRKIVDIPASALAFNPTTGAGTIFDSGTVFTRLVAPVYTAVRDEFRKRVGNAIVSSLGGFDTCYTGPIVAPTMTFMFSGMNVTLPPRERQEAEIRPPKQKITDSTELADYRLRKRKEFEDLIRRVRWNISVWIKYAQWEESQKDFNRARSVWERALEVDYRNHTLWLKYAEVEMKNKFINHARNVWDRAVTLLPRIDQLWYKYIHMEEMLGNVAGARQIFERWMGWMPDQQGWLSYIKFELRYNEVERARGIFERFVQCHPKVSAWIRYAKFEMKNGEVARARNVYERAVEKLADDEEAEMLFVAFAEFEERCKETERARCIYKFALDHIPKGRAEDLYRKFVAFEKQYGDKEGIEDAIVGKRRFQYEDEVRKNPLNYDAWFDYIRLEESVGNKERIREVYERAIANVPPAQEKRYWQRYIYLWINYALYEELDAEDIERTREVYRECLNLIPHEIFSFAKIWLLAAQFEIRQLNLKGARQVLGNAIGKAPKDKIFKKYIEIELQLGNIDRCRKLYEKYLEWSPENCYAWSKYAELERSLSETERARSIFELAIAQPALDMPELLWKAYIDFEISEGEYDRTRELYKRLLDRTKHLKVWISCAKFEASAMEEQKLCVQNARRVFEKALNYFRMSAPELKEERAMLLDEWLDMEKSFGQLGDVSLVEPKLPKKLKKRKQIASEDGLAGYEEYIDYVFPEEAHAHNLKILEKAREWKRQKLASGAED